MAWERRGTDETQTPWITSFDSHYYERKVIHEPLVPSHPVDASGPFRRRDVYERLVGRRPVFVPR